VRNAGYIYKGQYDGWFCPACAEFKEEEEPGKPPRCELHNREAERVSEESYFFALSAFQDRLLEFYRENPQFVQPEARANEVVSFVSRGLKDLSISRVSVRWGIPVPDDPRHTMYVWFDALSNYITALGFGNDRRHLAHGGTRWDDPFATFWPADVHIVGKDILRFHAVYWPAFLMAAGLEPPRMVYAHGMWLSGGRKMSKTLGNTIDLAVLKRFFPLDGIRYFCLREMVFGEDADFTYGALIDRINADLADGLGNLTSRTLTMIRSFCDGVIPSDDAALQTDGEREIEVSAEATIRAFVSEFDQYRFNRALEAAWSLIARVDKYLSDRKPWELARTPSARQRLDVVLATAVKALRVLAVLLSPVLPSATRRLWHQMGLSGEPAEINPQALSFAAAIGGCRIGEITPLFPRINKEKTMAEIESEKSRESAVTPSASPVGTFITIDDFAKVDLRAGTVVFAEKVEKADKLLRLLVDVGEAQPRQVVAGIAPYYTPEQLIGRRVILVANLQPRKLRGLESQGMVLAAVVGPEERPVLAGFLEDVPNGAKLR
ncbi:MAG TPA: methionine--tRNA ligase subunit beta, partial [Blastocatellia bacterium]|nr:methionine--tRNA ligase subunit beta [Blastocatellia bacterium]